MVSPAHKEEMMKKCIMPRRSHWGNLEESCNDVATHYAWLPNNFDGRHPSNICDKHATEIRSFSRSFYIKIVPIKEIN